MVHVALSRDKTIYLKAVLQGDRYLSMGSFIERVFKSKQTICMLLHVYVHLHVWLIFTYVYVYLCYHRNQDARLLLTCRGIAAVCATVRGVRQHTRQLLRQSASQLAVLHSQMVQRTSSQESQQRKCEWTSAMWLGCCL